MPIGPNDEDLAGLPTAPRRRRGARRRRSSESSSSNVQFTNPAKRTAAPTRRILWVILGSGALLVSAIFWMSSARQGSSATPAHIAEPAMPQVEKTALQAKAALLPKLQPEAAQKPVIETASIESLLAGKSESADWRIARLDSNEAVLVIEFPNLKEQGLAFNRAAAYIEKKNSRRDQVLSDADLAALVKQSGDTAETFYYGHDYSAEQMRQFFAQSNTQNIALNAQELRLRQILVDAALLQEEVPGEPRTTSLMAPGQQAVISFSALQRDDPATKVDEGVDALRRESTLRHELSHGEFFTRPAYQKQSWAFWQNSLNKTERALFRRMLAGMDYDAENELLMVNETQAILMHTPDRRAFDASNLGVTPSQLQELRQRFERSR